VCTTELGTMARMKPEFDKRTTKIISGSVSDEDAKKTYPNGWRAPKPYLRLVPEPK
jgi:alkyl hydroperoxide reductase subunit AhpC